MSIRKVNEVTNPSLGIVVTIYRDSESKDYLVRDENRPDLDCFTSDKSDAYSMMNKMFARASWQHWRDHT